MMPALLLLPQPQSVTFHEGTHTLRSGKLIAIGTRARLGAAQRLQAALAQIGVDMPIAVYSAALPADQIGIALTNAPHASEHPDQYRLTIREDFIHIAGGDLEPPYFYGVCTLIQIIAQHGAALPCLTIEDWPDFARRGVMLDISRDRVPTMAWLYTLIDRLAGWKINEVQLYTEHTFAYRQHPRVWAHASPMTAEQIMALDRFCQERFTDLVPNQNSFGHMHRWLGLDEYRHMAEVPEGHDWYPMFLSPRPFGLAPAVPESLPFLAGLYDELLPNFSSGIFNVGCDETFDLGMGRSKALCEAQGKGRVYLDFLKQIAALVARHGRTMQFWGDIIKGYPDLVPELPEQSIAMVWGYEADHPFDQEGASFAAAGVRFYVCPGTSSWLGLVGRTENAIGNLRSAAENGLRHGADGYLITDWGDYGHWQPPSVSYLGFAYGAAASWAYDANRDLDLPAALSRFAFDDPSGRMGQLAFDIGNAYRLSDDVPHINGANMVRALFAPIASLRDGTWRGWGSGDPLPAPSGVRAALAEMDRLAAALDGAQPADPRVLIEYRTAIGLWRHGCKRLILAAEPDAYTPEALAAELRALIAAYTADWLARSRPGGLGDSLARMMRMLAEYGQAGVGGRPGRTDRT
jgi:hypothetical protein